MSMTIKERNELLIRLDERTAYLEKSMSNHLKSHFRYSLLAWSTAMSAIITLLVMLLK